MIIDGRFGHTATGIVNEQNEGGNPTFRIGERVAVGYLEVEGTTKVKAGELKWSKATIKSGPTMSPRRASTSVMP